VPKGVPEVGEKRRWKFGGKNKIKGVGTAASSNAGVCL
jgi:hypothetical protein